MRAIAAFCVVLWTAPAWAVCPGYSVCPRADFARVLAHDPQAWQAQAAIDETEASTQATLKAGGYSFAMLVALLGQALVFDRTLSVNGTQACGLCHAQATGYTASIAAFAPVGGVMPGAVPWRAGFRAPQSLAYAAFAPVLTYRPVTQDFAGGNFWDSRATGLMTGSPSADQVIVPLTDPVEMALPDPACAVRRLSATPYAALFSTVWGAQSLSISWPDDTDARCERPANGRSQIALNLSRADRARTALTVQQIGLTVAAYEQSELASPFNSRFDNFISGQGALTAVEREGYALFTGRAHCSACHAADGTHALFTDFTSSNIGVPRNGADPFLTENVPGLQGYVANPDGRAFADPGLGGFLASAADINAQWKAQAPRFIGTFQVPTLRNAAARPAGFPRRYMHNGFFRNLDEVVHFFNTRDVLPVCADGHGVGVSCWPAPEIAANEEKTLTGNLGLSAHEEQALVAFMATLTDTAAP